MISRLEHDPALRFAAEKKALLCQLCLAFFETRADGAATVRLPARITLSASPLLGMAITAHER